MATDATGTPTTALGIPKYNTAADIPSGKGFNAAMDYIDDLIEARGAPPGASGVKVWNNTTKTWDTPAGGDGTKFLRDDGTFQLAGGPGDPVTALPGSPVDKQQALLVDSLTAPTYMWLFQYESGITDANKWMFLGGTPARNSVVTDEAIDTSGVWKNLTTNGPLITVPRAGIYLVEYHVQTYSAGGVANDFQCGPAIGDTTPTEFQRHNNPTGNAHYVPMSGTHVLTCAASDIIKLRYINTGSTGAQFGRRYLRVTPLRVA